MQPGTQSAAANIKIAYDMVRESMISEREAILRQNPKQLLASNFKAISHIENPPPLFGFGLTLFPGIVTGEIVFCSKDAQELSQKGQRAIFVVERLSVDDFEGLSCSSGIITTQSGKNAYGAYYVRDFQIPCIVSTSHSGMLVDSARRTLINNNGIQVKKGNIIKIYFVSIVGSSVNKAIT